MQEVHFHGRRSEGHRTLRGHARSTVLDTQTVVNSLPLNASDVPFRVVLTGSYNHTEQALVQRLHIANPVHIREAMAFLQHVGHPLYAGLPICSLADSLFTCPFVQESNFTHNVTSVWRTLLALLLSSHMIPALQIPLTLLVPLLSIRIHGRLLPLPPLPAQQLWMKTAERLLLKNRGLMNLTVCMSRCVMLTGPGSFASLMWLLKIHAPVNG